VDNIYLGFVGLLNCLCLWPLLILLHFVGVEVWEWPSAQVLLFLCINGLIGTVLSDLLWSYSVFYTSPLIASVGLSLTIPLAIGVERFLHHRDFTWSYLLGSGLVVSGFVLVNIASRQCEKDCWSRTKQCHCFKSNPTVDAPPDTILEDGQRTALVS
jgi:solute carrier family 35 protein F5